MLKTYSSPFLSYFKMTNISNYSPVCVFPSRLRPSSPSLVIHVFLASHGVWFPKWVYAFARGQGSRAPPLPGSCSPLTPHPRYFSTSSLSIYQDTPTPHPTPPLSLPHVQYLSHTTVEFQGAWHQKSQIYVYLSVIGADTWFAKASAKTTALNLGFSLQY